MVFIKGAAQQAMVLFLKSRSSSFVRVFSIIFSLVLYVPLSAQTDTAQQGAAGTGVLYDSVQLATDTAQPYYYRLNGVYLKSYWTDFKEVVARPFHWRGRDWAKMAVLTGATGLLMATVDKPGKRLMIRNQKPFLNSAGHVFEPLGNQVSPLIVAGMYVTSLVTRNRRLEHASLSIARSVAISTVIYTASKQVIRRQRPVRTDNPFDFKPPFTSKGYTSFPSGHANTMFSVATAFSEEYKDKKWVPWVAYSIATLTSVTRLYQVRHWTSDILVGAAIGHFVTKTIYRIENRKRFSLKPLP